MPAARMGDMHVCPLVNVLVPHVGGPIIMGSFTTLIGGMPAARMTDMCICVGPPDMVLMGEFTVLIGGLPAARILDNTAHGGMIILGCFTVLIGASGGGGAGGGAGGGGGGAGGAGGGAGGAPYGPGPLTPQQADALFATMAAQSDIAFGYPRDGCYARAHLMVERMQALGVTPGKAWTFASGHGDPLWVDTPNVPEGKVEWGYHVAPTVPVRGTDGTVRDMVIDPSMYDHPVTVDQWSKDQHDTPRVVQTAPGEAPTSRGGTGYWPSTDPPEGCDANAKDTMEEYKRKEGT